MIFVVENFTKLSRALENKTFPCISRTFPLFRQAWKERFMLEVFGNVFVAMYSTFLNFYDQISREKFFCGKVGREISKKCCISKRKHCMKLVLAWTAPLIRLANNFRCTIDPMGMGKIVYSIDGKSASSRHLAYKFADYPNLLFKCSVSICRKSLLTSCMNPDGSAVTIVS